MQTSRQRRKQKREERKRNNNKTKTDFVLVEIEQQPQQHNLKAIIFKDNGYFCSMCRIQKKTSNLCKTVEGSLVGKERRQEEVFFKTKNKKNNNHNIYIDKFHICAVETYVRIV